MVSSPTVQVPASSIDTAGISTLTSPRNTTDPRAGMMYNPTTWAASVPVGFYPLPDGRYVEFASQVWTNATFPTTPTDPKAYSAHTTSLLPSWIILNTAGHTAKPSVGYTIPMNTTNTARTLTACWAKPPVFFLLNTVTTTAGTVAVLQYFRVTSPGVMLELVAEETIPYFVPATGHTVLFDRGLYVSGAYMYVFGADTTTGAVYLARKPWGKVGTNTNSYRTKTWLLSAGVSTSTITDPIYNAHLNSDGTTTVTTLLANSTFRQDSNQAQSQDVSWEYQGSTGGWSHNIATAAPVMTASGILATNGPISAAMNHSTLFISTVTNVSGTRTATILATKGAQDPWRTLGTQPLGTSSTYAGGTLQFVPTLQAVTTPSGATGAIPYVISTLNTVSGLSSVGVSWNTWAVAQNS